MKIYTICFGALCAICFASVMPALSVAQSDDGAGTPLSDALAQQAQQDEPRRGFGPPAGRGPGNGRGRGFGPPAGRGPGFGRGGKHMGKHGGDERHDADHDVFHFLLTNHAKIKRTVTELPNGVETLTESKDPEVAAKIKDHVQWMQHRVEKTIPIRMRDPLFAEIFRHTDKIKMVRTVTKDGVRVKETSADPYVVKLIQSHAKVVSGFVARGFDEAMKNHPVPKGGDADAAAVEFVAPAIPDYGKVVRLPNAAQQPRDKSKILVDVTLGGKPEAIYPAIEKVARFVNIYQGAGREPATAEIAVVLHGDATLAVLNVDEYGKRFSVKGNPNLDCLHKLHEAGVQILVCGQSLAHKKAAPEDVVVFCDVAVSGLTAMVNLQDEGYRYIPLK